MKTKKINLSKRIAFKKNEIFYFISRGIIKNNFFKPSFRRQANLRTDISKIRNFSNITGRSHSINRTFQLSRIDFRQFSHSQKLVGVRKSSW